MYKSKLFEVFFALAQNEQRALGKFVRSPYHNQREDVVMLYDYMYAHRDLLDREVLRKRKTFENLFPQEPFDADKIDYVMSFFLKVLERFIIVQSQFEDGIEAQIRLAEAYRLLKLDKHFKQAWRYAQRLQENQPMREGNYFRRRYRLEYERYAYSANEARSGHKNLQELSNSFDAYYMGERLKQSCLILAHKAVYKTEYDMGPTDLLCKYLASRSQMFDDYPMIGLYYHYYQTLTETDLEQAEESFQQFKELFLSQIDKLPFEELQNLYLFSTNYCIRRYNMGAANYVHELLRLYKKALDTGILILDGTLSHASFLNITKTAIRVQDFEWVKNFIETYKRKLDTKYQDAYTNYALGEYYYSQKGYKDAMMHLLHIEHSDLLMNLSARALLLKIYYELEEIDDLEALLNSMTAFLGRKDEIGYHRENYKNIVRFARKLLSTNPFDKKDREKLRKEIEETTVLTERQWFLEQVDAMRR